jgi:glycosyltransferase involved in cell wall biosynthesis
MLKYSWVLPIKDEEGSLEKLIFGIRQVMRGQRFEVIAVNDGSSDKSLKILQSLAKKIPGLKVIDLKKSYGKWQALIKGGEAAIGEYVITIDSDLQDDPGEVIKLISKVGEGYEVVSGWRKNRQDPLYKIVFSSLGNNLVSLLFNKKFNDLNSPFKIYQRAVWESLPKTGTLLRFSLLFADRMGYKVTEVPINHHPRLYGKSKFGVEKYLRIIYDLILIRLLFLGSGRIK